MGLTFGKAKEHLLRDPLPYRLIGYLNSNFARDLEN